MRILVLGAAGRTGREVLAQALRHGHDVRAFVHVTPVEEAHAQLEVVRGDVRDLDAMRSAVAGVEAVVSVIGARPASKVDLYSAMAGNLVQAMAESGVPRVTVMSAVGAFARHDHHISLGFRLLMRTTLRGLYDDLEQMERRIRASALDWCIVRAAGLTDGPLTGDYRTSLDGRVLKGGGRISRADVAALLLKTLAGETYLRRTVTTTY